MISRTLGRQEGRAGICILNLKCHGWWRQPEWLEGKGGMHILCMFLCIRGIAILFMKSNHLGLLGPGLCLPILKVSVSTPSPERGLPWSLDLNSANTYPTCKQITAFLKFISPPLERGQTSGDGEGRGSLACCSPWGHKELDMTWWVNNSSLPR